MTWARYSDRQWLLNPRRPLVLAKNVLIYDNQHYRVVMAFFKKPSKSRLSGWAPSKREPSEKKKVVSFGG
jgi:hypothetical protein